MSGWRASTTPARSGISGAVSSGPASARDLTRAEMERLGFFVCVADLEEELIRALGVTAVEDVVDAQGDLGAFRSLQRQPPWRDRPPEEQLRRFFGSGSGRKIRYARLLVEALDLSRYRGRSTRWLGMSHHVGLERGKNRRPRSALDLYGARRNHGHVSRELPSGVVTLLFTDIEGSTTLLHELGDGYGAALDDHRRIVRAACSAHDGVEVDTQGDAFFVAFARASDAAAAAADAQRGLAAGPVRVRMGLHTGEPRVTHEGYVGIDVHRGARIAAVGHGGQVLLSQTTRTLVDHEARDLGAHRLKDLSAPERIYQLEIDGLPGEFPLLKTIEAGMKNLPLPRTSFVGRASELEAIDRLLEDPGCRLLTLVGPGGAGKTRLALEAAARRVYRYPHGVHFVPLASVASPDLLAPALAESLQLALDGAHSSLSAQEQLLDYLSERSTLLVLDNFEHLVEGSALLSEVIERAPHVELLTTSRERLNIQSEWVFDVEGLGLAENGERQRLGGAPVRRAGHAGRTGLRPR